MKFISHARHLGVFKRVRPKPPAPHALRGTSVAYQKDPGSLRHSLTSEACQMGRDGLGAQSIILDAMRCDVVRAGRAPPPFQRCPQPRAPEMGVGGRLDSTLELEITGAWSLISCFACDYTHHVSDDTV